MIKLNDKTLFVGQIKQLLKEFNLPKCHCNDNIYVNNSYYIDKNKIYQIKNNIKTSNYEIYTYNKKYLNITHNFDFESLYYDVSTHMYLGNYLRFLRDYKNINLMSMYNCSINRVLSRDVTFFEEVIDNKRKATTWESDDYNIYIVPIKFNQVYTIGVDCSKVEVCACLYDEQNNTLVQADKQLYEKSHYMLRGCSITKPLLYDRLKDYYKIDKDIFEKESTLKLLLKLPKTYTDSVVVLEGDYTKGCNANFNNKICKYILNDTDMPEEDLKVIFNSQIRPQLLSYDNVKSNYLIADRLFEYLTGNPISNISEPYDIEKLQKWCLYNDDTLVKDYNISRTLSPIYYGIWSTDMTRLLYEINQLILTQQGYTTIPYDCIGYMDKDLEKKLEYLGNPAFNAEEYGVSDYGGII